MLPRSLPQKVPGARLSAVSSVAPQAVGDGVLLIGDAAGLAYPQSGEGIRPAVESGLMAAQVILERRELLAPRARALREPLAERFGTRNPRQRSASWLPQPFRQNIAARLMATRSFARHVVIERWFLRTGQRAVSERWLS